MEQGVIVGIGTDIVDVWRLRRMDSGQRESFNRKNLSPEEISNMPDTNPETFMAGRYAAKGALAKALGHRGFSFASVTVLNDDSGRPCFKNPDMLLKNRDPRETYSFHLSISHNSDHAVAFVVVERIVEKTRNTWI
ncbi:MAG TPA: holo-ACP synthase [Spirochaetota bacterium]|nr:holo-ACP synthase [Spirochaetota bacterium]HPC40862.1 holo-ACP synthase [Spirochaetota bacterium]HPL19218.1 holo-ACP synthase [Spirochaetota bacterium]HQF07748.1 holo-ACP synthase [Spirochaetota bacterium]HQH96801.1 holo-ACP synthase [Spirochaetota bacterium]